MSGIDKYSLRVLEERDLEQVLTWRNSAHIRAGMYTDHIISPEEHLAWFKRNQSDPSTLHLVFELDRRPIGFVSFTRIDPSSGRCDWGFYLGETGLVRGSSTAMGYLALELAFGEKHWRKVCGEVFAFNKASLKYFERLGFVREGCLRQHVKKNEEYVDVVLFSMLDNEWLRDGRARVLGILETLRSG